MNSRVLHRSLSDRPREALTSCGAFICSDKGRHFDLSSGAGITCLGHSNEFIKAEMKAQIDRIPYAHSLNWTSQPVEELARLLTDLSLPNGCTMFLNSGAEAVEAACKLGAQYHLEKDCRTRVNFAARQYSYHGNTMFTLALGDHPRKWKYNNAGIRKDISRFPAYGTSTDLNNKNGLEILEYWLQYGSRDSFVVVVETIAGMTLGIEPAVVDYLVQLRKLCDEHGAILVYDEVLCGNYRTGQLFAWSYYQQQTSENIAPDIIAIGKGLTGGYFPLSAVIASKKVTERISQNSRKIWHSTTNQNHFIGCAAGCAAIYEYSRHAGKIAELTDYLQNTAKPKLEKIVMGGVPTIVTGIGTIYGIRLNPHICNLHHVVRKKLLNHNIVVYTDGRTIDDRGNFILLAPPYNVDINELDATINKIIEVLKEPQWNE